MIDIEQYRDDTGMVDWQAVREAEREQGFRCKICDWIVVDGSGKCNQCDKLRRSDMLTHRRLIRCPYCLEVSNPQDHFDYSDHLNDGPHAVYCFKCEREFTFETIVDVKFISPELKDGQ